MSLTQAGAGSPLVSLPGVRNLRLTGYHKYNGLLGVIFPSLDTLQVSTSRPLRVLPPLTRVPPDPMSPQLSHVEVPHPRPLTTTAMPRLRRLSLPSCKVLPAILTASPELQVLSVHGINCLQRLEELLNLPQPLTADKALLQAAALKHQEGGGWWPQALSDLSLGFSSSLRFRPKQIASSLAAVPSAVAARVTALTLRDSTSGGGGGRVVDDSVLATAVAGMSAARSLRVVDCGAVTCEGLVQALTQDQPLLATRLAYVEVAGCARVTRRCAEGLAAELCRPWLDCRWREDGDE